MLYIYMYVSMYDVDRIYMWIRDMSGERSREEWTCTMLYGCGRLLRSEIPMAWGTTTEILTP